MNKKLLLFDSAAIFFRSYYAFIHNPLVNKQGENISAVFGFINTILKVLLEENPVSVICAFDRKEPTFRHHLYQEYKANRAAMPADLASQLPMIHEFISIMGLLEISVPGYEADDIIGTLSRTYIDSHDYDEVVIATGDKDLFQLLNSKTKIYNLRHLSKQKEQHYFTHDYVKETFQFDCPLIRDYLALIGDTSDNIPGVPGIGPKTATKLLLQFGNLHGIFENLHLIKPDKLRDKLGEGKEKAMLSYDLTRIVRDLELPSGELGFVKTLKVKDAQDWLSQHEFPSLAALVEKLKSRISSSNTPEKSSSASVENCPFDWNISYDFDPEWLKTWVNSESDLLILKLKVGIELNSSWAFTDMKQFYMLIPDEKFYLLIEWLSQYLRSGRLVSLGLKQFHKEMIKRNIQIPFVMHDIMLAGYLVRPEEKSPNLLSSISQYLKVEFSPALEKVLNEINENQNMLCLNQSEDLNSVLPVFYQYNKCVWHELHGRDLENLYQQLELPFCRVLAEIENNGILIDTNYLKLLSHEAQSQIKVLESQIFALAGENFNILSPKQMGVVLFEKLKIHEEAGIKKIKKGKTGYSTGSEVLDLYSDVPIIGLIKEYRKLSKLDNTYLNPLREYIEPGSNRIKPCLNQMVAITGRLSSANPNLQNIPIRSPEGAQIRKAFKSADGFRLLSADYSQIELRILAHFSGDVNMMQAFKDHTDIHRRTAALIFNVKEEEVSPENRSQAKAINFGVIYGMGPHRLAKETGLSYQEAARFIENYFGVYKEVKSYIESQIQLARTQSYVTTLLGRRRYLPEINSDRQDRRINAEHMAVNTPIQGSAAELIKVSMNLISDEIKSNFPAVKMLLQIHDELLFEVPEKDVHTFEVKLKIIMESAMNLKVPLLVQIGSGENWLEAH